MDDFRDGPEDGVRMRPNGSRDRPVDRVTVPEAADLLGVTQSAVRKRIQRGTIPWDKDGEGRIFVYVDPTETSPGTVDDDSRHTPPGRSRDELLGAYRDQIDFLCGELQRKDTIIMSLTQRIPELEAAPEPRPEPRGSSETVMEGEDKGGEHLVPVYLYESSKLGVYSVQSGLCCIARHFVLLFSGRSARTAVTHRNQSNLLCGPERSSRFHAE